MQVVCIGRGAVPMKDEVNLAARDGVMPVYSFGPFVLDPADRRLTRDGRRVAVPAKAWQILLMLVEAGGRLVPHEAFRAKLWPNVVVEDRTLTVHMSTLRKALGDGEFI